MVTETTAAERAYERADRDAQHYIRLLAGNLSKRERHTARLLLIRAIFARCAAERAMEQAT